MVFCILNPHLSAIPEPSKKVTWRGRIEWEAGEEICYMLNCNRRQVLFVAKTADDEIASV